MEIPKIEIKRVNLKLPKYLHQILLQEKAKSYKSINLLIEEAIKKQYYETKSKLERLSKNI